MDAAAAVKEVADELKEKAEACGIDAADAFTDVLEDIKEQAKEGAGKLAEQVMNAAGEMKGMLDEALANPGSLAPGGMGACAAWYGGEVVKKLRELGDKIGKVIEILKSMIEGIAGPMKELAAAMTSAMAGILKTVKGLTGLPGQVAKLKDTVKGPEDIKDVDTDAMKKALDMSGLEGPLSSLKGLNKTLASAAQTVVDAVQSMADFLGEAPDLIRGAFAPPFPLCFASGVLMSQAPPIMKQLMDKVDSLKGLDLQPVMDMVKKVEDTLENLDATVVTKPLTAFAEQAGGSVDKLDNAKKAAGLASMAGSVPSVPKMW